MLDILNTDTKGHASSGLVDTCAIGHVSHGKDAVTTVMVSEAPNVAQDSQHMTVPVLLILSGIRVVVKTTSTVSGSILSILNTAPDPEEGLESCVGG